MRNPFNTSPQVVIRERPHRPKLNREQYVIMTGDGEDEWLRMHWRADVPYSRRETLLREVEP